jgi:hypothetical protein
MLFSATSDLYFAGTMPEIKVLNLNNIFEWCQFGAGNWWLLPPILGAGGGWPGCLA